MLTKEQENHLSAVLEFLTEALTKKYTAGAIEHGGTLSDMNVDDLLSNAIEEAIDQCVYLITLKQKLRDSSTDGPVERDALTRGL